MASFLDKQQAGATRSSYAKIITVLIATELVGTFESAMIFIALPSLMAEFQTDAATAGWAATSFLLVAAASAAICGRLGDIYGRKKMLVIVLGISLVGSIISFTAGSIEGVIIGRAFQGAAGATLPLGLGIARAGIEKDKVPGAIALVAAVSFIAGAGGSLVAGVMLDLGNWQGLFMVSGILGLIAAVMAMTMLDRSTGLSKDNRRIDYLGGLLFAPAVALVLYGVSNAAAWGITSARTLQFVLGGLALAAIWIWWELRVQNPMINLRLLKTNKMALTQLATAILSVGPLVAAQIIGPMIMLSPAGFGVGLGLSPTMGGLVIFGAASVAFICSPISGKIAAKVGARRSLLIGVVICVIGYGALFWAQYSVLSYIIAINVVFVGTMFAYTAFPNLVAESVPVENTSEGMGINTVTRTIFMGVGTTVTTMALASSTVEGVGVPSESAYTLTYTIVLVTSVIGFVLAWLIRDRKNGKRAAGTAAAGNEDLVGAVES
ncbi:MFS transporter [Glutamicibacter protophormiae]|uniref:MFS family permease n=1 Tax=Glutamicibacter protophormiae TaxID=37930 RepID=A0ABS4XN59_GLUPR|nr:MFS transporter [Glutamicibacter protophormiae]MBP2397815.1 MFS family permease [Glutamicibacter protophormiae]GGL86359.1 MFS transporter [Glutamicibacter protophormiae]